MNKLPRNKKNIFWFKEVDRGDIPLVGGKAANLGEMIQAGFPVPNGFSVSALSYFKFLEANQLKSKIYQELKLLDKNDPQSFGEVSRKIQELIKKGKISQDLSQEIAKAYLKLGGRFKKVLVAIRSSATAEDLPDASFAGQQETYLNVRGETSVLKRVHDCWASLFEARAIFYREQKGFDHFEVGIAVPIQIMIPSTVSGVMFTADPVTAQKNRIVIEAIWGLGEYIVQGIVSPDHYVVNRQSLEILKKDVIPQEVQLVKAKIENREMKVPKSLKNRRKLTDKQIVELAKIGKKIHQHYFFPQDIEWSLYKNKFYIIQSRPITTLKEAKKKNKKALEVKRSPILTGLPAGPGLAAGNVQIILTAKEIDKVKRGDVLVTTMTTPDFVPAMKRVNAIVTDKGGQTSHAAIVSRELGVPCIVGTKKATKQFKNDQLITVNGSKGEIYSGGLREKEASQVIEMAQAKIKRSQKEIKTATKIYVNLAEPELAEIVAEKQVDGVGLLRAEFMIAEMGVHPCKMIADKKEKVFIDLLAQGIEAFCQNFEPRPVVYRTNDFKTNEYRNLTGGKPFEPEEENPLIGFRGAARYLARPEVFEMELEAIKKVRKTYKNLKVMLPFVRTPDEFKKVKKLVVASGLTRSPSFELWLMVEIPSNVILLEDFIEAGAEGVSIGSNDLTMLTLGIDRDNQELAQTFDERNPAVLWALEKTIKTCNKHKITSSICGQAPSVFSELTEKLVEWGITSISVNPDVIQTTRELVYQIEAKITSKKK